MNRPKFRLWIAHSLFFRYGWARLARRTHDYKRNGAVSLYAAFDVASGQVRGRITKRHRAKEFLDFLKRIDRETDLDLAAHVILDNSGTHKTETIQKWLSDHPRFTFHFTPTRASWLNAVESWFSQLERRAIHRGVFTRVQSLRDEIKDLSPPIMTDPPNPLNGQKALKPSSPSSNKSPN